MLEITISGKAGSGKSTVARKLSEVLRIPFYSIGDIKRMIAEERGCSVEEISGLDSLLDDYQKKLKPPFVLDSRLGFYFKPASFKVFITVDERVAAKRIFSDKRDTELFSSVNSVLDEIQKRNNDDRLRFIKLYNVDFFDLSHYDLVVDSTNKSVEDVVEIILNEIKKEYNF